MKVGDIVQRRWGGWNAAKTSGQLGIVIRLFEKKCWRTESLGATIQWDLIDPEPHAEVMFDNNLLSIPLTDLVVSHE